MLNDYDDDQISKMSIEEKLRILTEEISKNCQHFKLLYEMNTRDQDTRNATYYDGKRDGMQRAISILRELGLWNWDKEQQDTVK
jgi:hypothetical protein